MNPMLVAPSRALRLLVALLVPALAGGDGPASAQASASEAEVVPLALGRVLEDQPFEQRVEFENADDTEWVIDRVQLSAPWSVTELRSRIPPGERGGFTLRLGHPRAAGPLDGVAVLSFAAGRATPIVFELSIEVVPSVELVPRPAFFLVVERGESRESVVEIVNHRDEPLRLDRVELSDPRLTGSLEPLEAGRRYRLTVRMSGEGTAGRGEAEARIAGGDPARPGDTLRVPVFYLLREAVYAFPEQIDFGDFPRSQLNDSATAELVQQTLLVFRKGEPGFEAKIAGAPAYLRVRAEQGAEGDRWQFVLGLDPESTPAGELAGEIVVETNDSRFPRLVVPYRARLGAPPG